MRADVLSKSPSVAQGVRVNSPAPSEDQSVFVHELQKHGTEAQPLKTKMSELNYWDVKMS